MAYLDNRNQEIEKLHGIYNKDMPDIVSTLIDIPEILRINNVSKKCGIDMTSFEIYNYKYSRLDHSIGVALILSNYLADEKQIIAGLIHDIATPSFLYSEKELKKDSDERPRYNTYDAVIGSDRLFEYFMNKEIQISEICDCAQYPIIYKKTPKLSADTLENILHESYFTKMCDLEEIRELYDNLVIFNNEDGEPEFIFKNALLGKKFCRISLELGRKARSYEAKFSIKYIAKLLDMMIKRSEINEDDLYKYGERAILEIGLNSSYNIISDGWKELAKMKKVYTRFTKTEEKECIRMEMEPRYVDPLVKVNGEIKRVSKHYPELQTEIEAFLNSDTDLYMYAE